MNNGKISNLNSQLCFIHQNYKSREIFDQRTKFQAFRVSETKKNRKFSQFVWELDREMIFLQNANELNFHLFFFLHIFLLQLESTLDNVLTIQQKWWSKLKGSETCRINEIEWFFKQF